MKRPVTPVPLLLLLLLLATLSSCRRDAAFHDALVRAEALMETDPQQARAVLAEIEDSILKIEDYPAPSCVKEQRVRDLFSTVLRKPSSPTTKVRSMSMPPLR